MSEGFDGADFTLKFSSLTVAGFGGEFCPLSRAVTFCAKKWYLFTQKITFYANVLRCGFDE